MENPLRLVLASVLSAVLSVPVAANKGRVQTTGKTGPTGQGGIVQSGASTGIQAGTALGLAPSLIPSSLPNPVDPVVFEEAEAIGVEPTGVKKAVAVDPATPFLSPAVETVRLPASSIKAGRSDKSGKFEPNIPGGAIFASPKRTANPADGNSEDSNDGASPQTVEAGAVSGGIFFDGARRISQGLTGALQFVRRGFTREDSFPGFPGKVGDTLRVGGKRYQLDKALDAPSGQALYIDRKANHEPTLIHIFSAEEVQAYELQREALLELAKTDIPHNKLLSSSDAGRLLVQDSFEESSAFALVPGRDISYSQWTALPDLFYKLIKRGKTVDLSAKNIKWSHWRSHWAIQDAESFEDGNAWDVLGQWLLGDRAETHGVDPVKLLRAMRGRFGPDSSAWKQIVQEGKAIADAKRLLEALAAQDAERPPPPSLSFEAATVNDALGDKLVTERQMQRHFGFSPMKEKGPNLHFDKGKLNTSIREISPKGEPWVRKVSSQEIIRNELLLRKVVHRWFGAYFDTPWSMASYNGYDSYMMMEKVEGGHWGRGRFSTEQRVALAILMNTFGVGDVNLGNIMSSRTSKKPILIDFEQALSRKYPVTSRIPDESILHEMPWVDTRGTVDPEDYHRGIAEWRELFAKPETQAELRQMLADSGLSVEESVAYLARFKENVYNLPYTLQADVEFANYFYREGR